MEGSLQTIVVVESEQGQQAISQQQQARDLSIRFEKLLNHAGFTSQSLLVVKELASGAGPIPTSHLDAPASGLACPNSEDNKGATADPKPAMIVSPALDDVALATIKEEEEEDLAMADAFKNVDGQWGSSDAECYVLGDEGGMLKGEGQDWNSYSD